MPPPARRLAPIGAVAAAYLALMGLGVAVPALARVLDLALPFFGLIGLGFACGRLFDFGEGAGEAGLRWMNVFIVYLALPALFFTLVSKTPIQELANARFVLSTLAATACAFAVAFVIGWFASRGDMGEAAIQGAGGAYANVGYMGPGLTISAFGAAAAAPAALVFVTDTVFLFAAVPLAMAIARSDGKGALDAAWFAFRRIVTHPFNIATAVAIAAAAFAWQPPPAIGRMVATLSGAAAPSALFALGVTVGLRPLGALAREAPALIAVKLVLHPLLAYTFLTLAGVTGTWAKAGVLMASLPPALNVFVLASQYGVYVERASNLVLFGTLVSVATVTALLWFLA